MSKKEAKPAKKKPCNCGGKCSGTCCQKCYGTLWIAGSNISEETRHCAMEFLKDGGTVYWLEGKPPGGGCLPGQPGCQ